MRYKILDLADKVLLTIPKILSIMFLKVLEPKISHTECKLNSQEIIYFYTFLLWINYFCNRSCEKNSLYWMIDFSNCQHQTDVDDRL